MPIIEDLTISKDIRLIVWEISETINDLKTEDLLSKDSLKLLNQRKSEIHKKQFLAIRNILMLCLDKVCGDKHTISNHFSKPFVGFQHFSLLLHATGYRGLTHIFRGTTSEILFGRFLGHNSSP